MEWQGSLEQSSAYQVRVYAINAKGRSDPVVLQELRFKGVAKYTGEGQAPTAWSSGFVQIYKKVEHVLVDSGCCVERRIRWTEFKCTCSETKWLVGITRARRSGP